MSKSKVDSNARYLKTHEWARLENGEIVTGISDHAQEAMGDLVYVEVPKVGDVIAAGDRFGVVESVKAASDVYMPISGTITAVNSALEATPEGINADAFGAGWIIKFTPANPADFENLLDAQAYQSLLDAEEK